MTRGSEPQESSAVVTSSSVEGTLVLRALEQKEGRTLLEASLSSLSKAAFTLMGHDVSPEVARSQLESHRALDEVDERGVVAVIHLPKGAPEMFQDVIHALLSELRFELSPEDQSTWTTREWTVQG